MTPASNPALANPGIVAVDAKATWTLPDGIRRQKLGTAEGLGMVGLEEDYLAKDLPTGGVPILQGLHS